MITVNDIMTKDLISVSPETEIVSAAKILLDSSINGLPVVDNSGKLVGILCQSDLIAQQKTLPFPSFFTLLDGAIPLYSKKHIEKEVQKIVATTVAHIMTPNPVTVNPDMSLEEVATIMVKKSFHTLPVVVEGKLAGIIGKEDILRTLMPEIEKKDDL